jgi:hypothetical protein
VLPVAQHGLAQSIPHIPVPNASMRPSSCLHANPSGLHENR